MTKKLKNLNSSAKASVLLVIVLIIGALFMLNAKAATNGDVNNDGNVDITDLSLLLGKWGTADAAADVNDDNTVNIFDLSILITNWGAGTIPNPNEPPANTCLNPVFTTSDTNGGWSTGGFYVHNNMWNASSGETLFACSHKSWYVEATGYTGTSVKTYPNVHKDLPNAFTTGVPYNNYSTITSTFAGGGPKVGIYNVAYDLWLNGVGWGGGTTEMMIWTENFNQRPLGSIKATYTGSGNTFDVWHYNDGDANVVSFVVRQTQYVGNYNLKAMVDWAITKGYIPPNPSVNQIGYGVEICSTNGTKQRFVFTDFSLTMN